MFIRLLVASSFLIFLVQSAATNSSKGQSADALTLPKQGPSLYDDYDLNDPKVLGTNGEGSGGAASLDEYADDEEEEQLSKVTANSSTTTTTIMITTRPTTTTSRIITTSSSTSTTTTTLRTTTTTPLSSSSSSMPSRTTRSTATPQSSTTTTFVNKWTKTTTSIYEQTKKKTPSSTTLSTQVFNDLDASEFKDEHEDYTDDLEDDAYYNEPTVSTKVSTTSVLSSRYPAFTTRQSPIGNHTTPLWILFSFLTRPPIAAGILAGLAVGILTSIILLICIIRRYHTREKSHSSYTTGLLYPNQYGYSKSPQEFYA